MYEEYSDYIEYDEDDFFYHMYFDEVSTTPLPSEFYDILETVSGGNKAPAVVDYPNYGDLFNNRKANFTLDGFRKLTLLHHIKSRKIFKKMAHSLFSVIHISKQ